MEARDFWRVYVAGKNKETEARAYAQWCAILPHVQDKTLYDFKVFYERATGANIDRRDPEEILADIDKAMRRLNNGN